MFRNLLIAGVCAALAATPSVRAVSAQTASVETRYVPGVEDLPLMVELFAIKAAPLRFDSPSGRIVVAYAEGRVSRASVASFYGQTLAPLGWERLEPLLFRRDAETLRVEVDDALPVTRVRFFLAPAKP
jgi:hypothetical protein